MNAREASCKHCFKQNTKMTPNFTSNTFFSIIYIWNNVCFLPSTAMACTYEVSLHATFAFAGVEMIRSNVEEIKALFSSLLLSVQSTLKLESSADNVRQFMISFFECDFPKTMDIKELFATVTLNCLWDYQHYSPLES